MDHGPAGREFYDGPAASVLKVISESDAIV